MIIDKGRNLLLPVMLMCMSLYLACAPRSVSNENVGAKTVDLQSLWDQSKSYHYLGNYEFIPLRPWRGAQFLEIRFDSVRFTDSIQILCLSGQVMQYGDTVGIQGAQVVVGTVLRHDGQITSDTTRRPTHIDLYEIIPHYEDTTDAEGRFALCAEIGSASSLMIANESYHLRLYDVGKLVDSSWTQ